MIVILDTTLFSNFAHVQHADWLELLFGNQAVTTAEVMAELRQGETLGFVPHQDWRWLSVVELTKDEQVLALEYYQRPFLNGPVAGSSPSRSRKNCQKPLPLERQSALIWGSQRWRFVPLATAMKIPKP